MLSAFTARPIVELKARNKAKIDSLVAYGDRLLVGLNTGVLRIYRVNEQSGAPADALPVGGAAGGGDANHNTNNNAPFAAANTSPTTANEPTHLLRELEKFSPRAIEQLAIIKEANTLISLSNYAVSLHDLQTFTPLPGAAPLPGTKNASAFAVTSNIIKDPATGIPEIVSRLAVAVKRRLLLWSWYASELSGSGVGVSGGGAQDGIVSADGGGDSMAPAEITLSETIRSLTWASATKLVVGMNAGYVLVDVVSRNVEEIVGNTPSGANGGSGGDSGGVSAVSRFGALGSASMGYMGLGNYMPKPLAAKLADGEMLLAKDVHTLFITDSGKPVDRRGIPWPVAPESVGYSYPYILALQPPTKGSLEVRNPSTLSLLQTIAVPNATQLHVPPPSVSLAHAGKGFHVSSERGIWKMDATGYDSQIDALVAQGHLDEAISLLGLLEDALLRNKSKTLRDIKMQKAEKLFRQKKYLAAMDLFNEEDVHAPPERVFRFFPRSIVGDMSDDKTAVVNETDADEDGEGGNNGPAKNGTVKEDDADDTNTAPPNSDSNHQTNGKTGHTDASTSAPQPEASSSLPLGGGFTKAFWGSLKVNSETASVASAPKGSTDSDGASVKGKQAVPGSDEAETQPPVVHANGYVPLEGKELISAAEALNSYLAGTRARLQRVIDPATGKLKKPRGTENRREGSAPPQYDSDWGADVDDDTARESRLRTIFTLVDTTMFRVLMLIRPKLASSLFRIPNFCDPDVVNERLLENNRFNELVDFFYGKRLHRPALELLKRFGDVGGQTDEDKKVYGENVKTSASGDASDATVSVPPTLRGPQRTIAYLQSLPPAMIDLILEFSAWTLRADPVHGMDVFLADSENAETLPRDRVVRFLAGIDARLELRYLEHIISELNDLTPDFHNRLIEQWIKLLKDSEERAETNQGKNSAKEDPSDSDMDGEGSKEETWEESMARLVVFLKESKQYSLLRAFGLIPRDDAAFYEAQATVLSNMDQHKQALEIYVFKMKDFAKAEEYCNQVHKAQELAQPVPMSSPGPLLLSSNNNQSRRVSASKGDDANDGVSGDNQDKAAAPSIYHTLLSLYLTPPPQQQRQLAPALDLLSRHGSRLPASSTLQLIPDSLPVAELASYFRGRMRAANSVVNEGRIEKGLRQTAVLAAQASLLLGRDDYATGGVGGQVAPGGRNRRVAISEERACGVCHKRIGGSVVAVLPDNTVVHYGCLNRAGQNSSHRTPSWR
ncbi:AvaB protein [Sporothrix schenckii 1099-18]|uniref:AvaB protein n=1 Tax=Sporothrix schenckii 1099-18 TaxID=1397361 RepID=A0A0F2M2M4_SPOSC|nr:AvaB protein [Sporothrix schenckii 1099-18]KJR83937.1 AvaB protein [Sporothrix schenckii 1099-18]